MSLKTSIKNIWSKVVSFVKSLYSTVDSLADKYCPVAIKVVNFLKDINESTTGDILEVIVTAAIPGKADDVIVDEARKRLRNILPKIVTQLSIINAISTEQNVNKQLIAICQAINMSDNETKNAYYHTFCAMSLQALSDGKLTWSESVHLAEYYYINIYKK